MQIEQIGIDIGENSFHVIGLGREGDIVLRRQFTRSRLISFFEQRSEEHLHVGFGWAGLNDGDEFGFLLFRKW